MTKFLLFMLIVTFLGTIWFLSNRDNVKAYTLPVALHFGNELRVFLPKALGEKIKVELLDAEDKVIASGIGTTLKLQLPAGLKREDLVWYRLRYTANTKTEILLIGKILRYPIVKLLAQRELIAGSAVSPRLVVLDNSTGEPLEAEINIELLSKNGSKIDSIRATTDKHGTIQPRLRLPQDEVGQAKIAVTVDTEIGSGKLFEEVNIVKREAILLTLDKPLYQPGHLVHIRALALDRISRKSIAGEPITFEIEDAKGNKVFKRKLTTDEFGVASAQFQLAEEVNMGTYKLRAILGTSNTQERSFIVDRYVLPKFKVSVKFQGGEDERLQKRYYGLGDVVSGRIEAKYLFGKPVQNAKVTIKMTTFDVERVELGKQKGYTDGTGIYGFALKIPNQLVGRTANQAKVALEVEVVDSANHKESRIENLFVSKDPIMITAIPEGGELAPKLKNKVYVLTSYPDGSPAQTQLSGTGIMGVIQTGSDGIATIEVEGGQKVLKLSARDLAGRLGKAEIQLETRSGEDSLLVRTNKSLYHVGDNLEVSVISSKQSGSVYLDIIKDRQTVLTQALELKEGQASTVIDITADLFGIVEIRGYIFGRNAETISDRRMVMIDPADDLQIEAKASKESFRPGEQADIDIRVRDRLGRPVRAILDLQVVDEAVFALSERQPGFEKVFMYLEEELLKPKYEIHFHAHDIIPLPIAEEPVAAEKVARRERVAAVLLSAAKEVTPYSIEREYGRAEIEAKEDEYYDKYYELSSKRLSRIVDALNNYYATGITPSNPNKDLAAAIAAGLLSQEEALDPWGRNYIFNKQHSPYLLATSQFADQKEEQQTFWISESMVKVSSSKAQRPFNGKVEIQEGVLPGAYCQITGLIRSTSGGLAGSQTKLRRREDGKIFKTVTDRGGSFSYSGLNPGSYELTVEAEGHYGTTYSWIILKAGDRASVEVNLDRAPTKTVHKLTLHEYSTRWSKNKVPLEAADGIVLMTAAPNAATGVPARRARNGETTIMQFEKQRPSQDNEPQGSTEPKVRSYFPETLYVNPALITDQNGTAKVSIPMADSITTWRLSMLASTKRGLLGSTTTGIRVFQDFFIDLDLPVSLTQNDLVQIPVAVYNYLSETEDVEVTLKPADWYELVDDTSTKTIKVAAEEVSAVTFRIKANKIGQQTLTASARLVGRNSAANGDAIARSIEVRPDGEQQETHLTGRLQDAVSKELQIPQSAIAEANKILIKLYPGPFSQVVEGLDSIMRMPSGCFEQTSSANYPNVLALDYMKTTKRITPEIQAKAEGFISIGYQRLVTFEVPGGGFSWFGNAPANKILTGYGLMQFHDMSRVYEVDERIISRTQQWLAAQQKPDGSWEPDTYFINEGATNNYQTDKLRIAAYLGWVLSYTGYGGEAVEKAKQYVVKNLTGKEDAYTLAVIANFAADYKKDASWTQKAVSALVTSVIEDDKKAQWKMPAQAQTPYYGQGDIADIETTALAVQALIKAGSHPTLASKALQYLVEKKDSYGNWYSTQATIQSLKALLLSTKGAADAEGIVTVKVNGEQVASIKLDKDNNELLHQVVLKQTPVGRNLVELSFSGKGSLLYQAVGRYFVPWKQRIDGQEPLSISLNYDRTQLEQDDIVTAQLTVVNNLNRSAEMVMVDLGIPPGFEVLAEDLQDAVSTGEDKYGKLTKFSLTSKQILLYLDGLRPAQRFTLKYRLKAKYPLKVKTPESRVYEYYNPSIGSRVTPVELKVRSRS
ncbi:MAG: alpha-2-macroglobulin family protein [Acidobacteriota bacterium]|nr:MG2 domain-containing protein [Blastocatellia bacterium]MDW8411133.1 alpha-2-macroglobulin family protein [Acidobacteriota bacterium]